MFSWHKQISKTTSSIYFGCFWIIISKCTLYNNFEEAWKSNYVPPYTCQSFLLRKPHGVYCSNDLLFWVDYGRRCVLCDMLSLALLLGAS